MKTIWIGLRSADAVTLFERLADEARLADGRDGALEVELDSEYNENQSHVKLVFNNDDMERTEMSGRTIVDWEA